jgi:hypothetical protein
MIVFLIAHIAAVVLFVGPAAVAASMFPGAVPLDDAAGAAAENVEQTGARTDRPPRERSEASARLLHRISRVYGTLALIVPAAGLVLAIAWNKFDEAWLIAAMSITVVAGVLYAVRIVPAQKAALAAPASRRSLVTLGATTGVFNLLWAIVLVLMVWQPGGSHHA